MTEQTRKGARRPTRVAVLAAALAAALAVTACAANPAGVARFLSRFSHTITVRLEDSEGNAASLDILDVAVHVTDEERIILLVDGEETDITEAMADLGSYTWERVAEDGSRTQVEVNTDGKFVIQCFDAAGTPVLTYEQPTPEELCVSMGGKEAESYVLSMKEGTLSEEDSTLSTITLTMDEGQLTFDLSGESEGGIAIREEAEAASMDEFEILEN